MAPAQTEKRIADLRARIEKANYEYHVLDQPTISDESYDALIKQFPDSQQAVLARQRLEPANRPTR